MLFGVTWPLAAFEGCMYALFIICFVHAMRQGSRATERVALLLTGTVYGVILESLTIYQLHAYYYGHFLIMFHDQVPLAIGVGWGIILYSGVAFADALRLTGAAWAATVGLLGLGIDLTMDAVAIRLGMWNWRFASAGMLPSPTSTRLIAPDLQWFGVPFGNFYAWFIVLVSVAALFRAINPAVDGSNVVAVAGKCLLAILGSVTVLIVLDQAYVSLTYGQWWPVAVEIGGALAVIAFGFRGKGAIVRDMDAIRGLPALAVPLTFHGFFLGMLIVLSFVPALMPRADMTHALPAQFAPLLAISLAVALASVGTHLWRKRTVPALSAPVAVEAGRHASHK
jgi:hypothetical protein